MRTLVLVLFGLLAAAPALATNPDPVNATWRSLPLTNLSATGTSTFNGITYNVIGNSVYGRVSTTGVDIGTHFTAPATIQNFPVVVPLQDGINYIFVTANDGFLYKLKASDLSLVKSVSLGRASSASCTAIDMLQATPSVQLKAFANASYTPTQDLVFVPTYHGCGDTALNEVFALDAATLALPAVWTFNGGGIYQVDYISQGCSIDYTRNQLYCGANLSAGKNQNTVFAINTNNGNLVWSANKNSVHTRPQLSLGSPAHVYVADMIGRLHALNPTTGAEDWSVVLSTANNVQVTLDLWSEFRKPYGGYVFVTDSLGHISCVLDAGTAAGSGLVAWQHTMSDASVVRSIASVSPTQGFAYVGTDHGKLWQLSVQNGNELASRDISATPAAGDDVTDATLDIQSSTDINRVIASSFGTSGAWMVEFPVPFTPSTGQTLTACTLDSDCSSYNLPASCVAGNATNECCSVGKCDANGNCYPAAVTSTNACVDGFGTCTTGKLCQAGACFGAWSTAACAYGAAQCSVDAARGCGPTQTCLKTGSTWSCVDTDGGSGSSGATYCGSLSRTCDQSSTAGALTWGGNRSCVSGVCVRQSSFCTPPTDAEFASIQSNGRPLLANAAGLTFDRDTTGGMPCHAWVSTYDASNSRSGSATLSYSASSCNGTGGSSCGTAYTQIAAGGSASASFTDPIGFGMNQRLSTMRVTISGQIVQDTSCHTGTLSLALNGTAIGGTLTPASSGCASACTAACSTLVNVTIDFTNIDPTLYKFGMSNTLVITSDTGTGGTFRLFTASVSVIADTGTLNYIRRAYHFNPSFDAYQVTSYPGYMHGIVFTENAFNGAVAEVYVPFIANPTGLGQLYPAMSNQVSSISLTPSPGVGTSCDPGGAGGCPYPFTIPGYNDGPSPLASDRKSLNPQSGAGGGGLLWVGNYLRNADVSYIGFSGTTYQVTSPFSVTPPPWVNCCAPSQDRVTALDAAMQNNPDPDPNKRLRVAVGHKLYQLDQTRCSTMACPAQNIIDFTSTADPPAFVGATGGVGNWATLGFQNIEAIVSIAVDPLNKLNDAYLEVREKRPGTGNGKINYLVHVKSDLSVRPVFNYTDTTGKIQPGMLADFGMITPTDKTNSFFIDGDGRISAASQVFLHRLVPVSPNTSGNATVTSYLIPK